MKTASTLVQVAALAACLAVQARACELPMPGMRRALQTIEAIATLATRPQPPVLLSSGG